MTVKREKVSIKNFDENAMYCPSCLTKLESNGSFYYEDACGSRIPSIKWVCPTKGFINSKTGTFQQCLCHEYETFWNDDGEIFSGVNYYKDKASKPIPFIHGDNTYSAFNSIGKQCEVEIFKNGLPSKKYLSPALCLWFLRPVLEYTYKSDRLGNIIKTGWKVTYLSKDERGNYCIGYISGIKMLKFCIKLFNRKRKTYLKHPESTHAIDDLYNEFKKILWDKRWWRQVVSGYFNVFYFRLKKELEKKVANRLNK